MMRVAVRQSWLLLWAIGTLAGPVAAADWPMWRCDPRRSAAGTEALASPLHLQWTRELPAPLPAWPNEPRLGFDTSYQPVVAERTLLIGSPNDGSVTALDTQNGQERWKFFAEGPVRFAPVASGGRVFVGSDDGFLYCLDLRDGRERWRCRGAPQGRADRRQLGNARLISFWPVRGGPVLADGVVYFAAGIWPTMGVFVVAVDAQSGQPVWRNDGLGFLETVRLDHNELGTSGLSPQGYLAVEGDLLLVPNGRSLPARLERKSGKLLSYIQGYRNGDCRVAAIGKYAFVGQSGVLDLETGREVGSRWAAAGKDAPNKFDGSKFHLFEGPIHPYKQAACSARSALAPGVAYDVVAGGFAAFDLAGAKVEEYDWKTSDRLLRPWRWEIPLLWKYPAKADEKRMADGAIIRSANRLYAHAAGQLTALELPAGTGSPTIAWKQPLAGAPGTLLAADGRLFAVTREGTVHCFGPAAGKPSTYPRTPVPLASAPTQGAKTAAEILERTGVQEGYCLVLGIGSGDLVGELLRQSKPGFKLIAVDPDQAKVRALRQRLAAADLYGSRAEAFLAADPSRFPFPPYLASLIVAADPALIDITAAGPTAKLFEILRPYGGTLCLDLPGDRAQSFSQWLAAAKLPGAEFQQAGRWSLLRRVGPLAGAASWTHETADAARTFYSPDHRVKPPLGILWYGDGAGQGFFKEKDYGTGVKPQVIGGRLVALQVRTSTLQSYDVFTGRTLWQFPVPAFTRYASMGDGIYVAGGGRCDVLDPASGQPIRTFTFDPFDGQPSFVADIRVGEDTIVIAVAQAKVRVIEKGLWDASTLIALDRKTGRTLWKREARERFNNSALALGGGKLFCVDSLTPIETDKTKALAAKGEPVPSILLALDLRSGEVRWTATMMNRYRVYPMESWLGIQGQDDGLAYSREHDLVLAGKQQNAWAFQAASGKQVWQRAIGGAQPWILRGDVFVHQGGGVLETSTGKPAGAGLSLVRGGCNYAVGSEHCIFLRNRSVRYIDWTTRANADLFAVRSGCSNSLIPADGLLNVPGFAVGCVCNYPIQTSFAMVHFPEATE